MSGSYFDPSKADFIAPIGLEHFFDAFALVHKRGIREAAAAALEIQLDDIQTNLVVKQSSARRFQLTPVSVPDDPPAKRAKRTKEPVSPSHDSTAALLKTVAVMSLLELSQKEVNNSSPGKQNQNANQTPPQSNKNKQHNKTQHRGAEVTCVT